MKHDLNLPPPIFNNDNTVYIALSGKFGRGKYFLADIEDYDRIIKHNWHLTKLGYIATTFTISPCKRKYIFLHKFILEQYDLSKRIDHKNHNKLDNRKINLRFCNHQQNSRNRKPRINLTSKYHGVYKMTNSEKWASSITIDKGNTMKIGVFDEEIDAAEAYDIYAKKYFAEFASLNFPWKNYENYQIKDIRKKKASVYFGLAWDKRNNKWYVSYKKKFLGRFDDEKEAAKIYDYELLNNGKEPINFPNFCYNNFEPRSRIEVNNKRSIATLPNLMEEWDWEKNEPHPSEITIGSKKYIWWVCKNNKNHKWKANPNNRINGPTGCPECYKSNKKKVQV